MRICKQGNGHYVNDINNQDFYYADQNLKMVMDGCSEGKFSEVGTRLFAQFFEELDNRFDVQRFEKNVDEIFSKIVKIFSKYSGKDTKQFVVDNMLFTILACFELEDRFVVKFIGDGYIVAINNNDMVSYIRLSYGKTPPYYAYNMLKTENYDKKLEFKTFEFSKKDFKKIGIASDGFAPIVEKKISDDFESIILQKDKKYTPEGVIKSNHTSFFDDVTILI